MPAVLAAFIARTILESDPLLFSPEKELTSEGVDTLIRMSIARLCEKDAPSLETIKMQVAFDSTYVRFEEELDKSRKAREEKKRELVRAILAVKPRGSTDFETLTALYRQIFTYLLHVSRAGSGLPGAPSNTTAAEDPGSMERAVEREIAAALESVFPRIGLKSFVQLSSEEKRLQLEELARIVTGIRLFNREGGKGGAGLDHVEDAVATTVSDLRDALDAETAEQHDLALRYQETLVYCHLRQPPGVAPAQLERWAQELANRRQYGAYLTSLAEDAAASARRVQVHRERFATEMDELQALVGGRASVPKEHVYPKFDAIATAWFALDDELRVVESRVATLEELHQFRESYNMTCGANHPVYRAARLESHAKPDGGGAVDDEAEMAEAVSKLGGDQAAAAVAAPVEGAPPRTTTPTGRLRPVAAGGQRVAGPRAADGRHARDDPRHARRPLRASPRRAAAPGPQRPPAPPGPLRARRRRLARARGAGRVAPLGLRRRRRRPAARAAREGGAARGGAGAGLAPGGAREVNLDGQRVCGCGENVVAIETNRAAKDLVAAPRWRSSSAPSTTRWARTACRRSRTCAPTSAGRRSRPWATTR